MNSWVFIDKLRNYQNILILLFKLIAAKTDEELQSVLSDDDNMDLLQAIGYRGNPFKEKINSKEKLLQCVSF